MTRLLLDIVLSTAPAPVRSPLAALLSDDEREISRAAAELARLKFVPAAHVLRAMLPQLPHHLGEEIREVILQIESSLAGGLGTINELDHATLEWMIHDASRDVWKWGILFLVRQGAKFDKTRFLQGLEDGYLVHADRGVRLAALEAATFLSPEDYLARLLIQLGKAIGTEEGEVHFQVVEIIKRLAVSIPSRLRTAVRTRLLKILSKLAKPDEDRDGAVRRAAIEGWTKWQPRVASTVAHNFLEDADWEVRELAASFAAEHGTSKIVDQLVALGQDERQEVREAGFRAVSSIAPSRLPDLAIGILKCAGDEARELGFAALRAMKPPFDVTEILLPKIPRMSVRPALRLLELVKADAPERYDEWLAKAMSARDSRLRGHAVTLLAELRGRSAVPQLVKLVHDRSTAVQSKAAVALHRVDPAKCMELALDQACSQLPMQRCIAIRLMSLFNDPLLVSELVRLARDEDDHVRGAAIRVLARYDDPRVFSELVSSLQDSDATVRDLAEETLEGKHGRVPTVERLVAELGTRRPWDPIRRQVREVMQWSAQVGREILGRPVRVHQYRQGIGRTPVVRRNAPVDIEISDLPVTSGHVHGEQIMKAIGLHEIGHHAADLGERGAKATRGIARSKGLDEIYEILIDERLERVMRSRRPEWGVFFDRLASYAFAQNEHVVPLDDLAAVLKLEPQALLRSLAEGTFPGRPVKGAGDAVATGVAMRDQDWLRVPGLVPPLMGFLACLRCGYAPEMHPDANVTRAVRLVPRDLKDLSHAGVLKLSRQIARLIGRSADHRRGMRRMRQLMRLHHGALSALQDLLDRMVSAGQIPGWKGSESGTIRETTESAPISPALPGRALRRHRFDSTSGQQLNLKPGEEFEQLESERRLLFTYRKHAEVLIGIRKHVRQLRGHFERLGLQTVDEYASRRGRRLDISRARLVNLCPSPNILVHSRDEMLPNAYLGVLIDRSGSMRGRRMVLAKQFGALVAEAARGMRGIEGHVSAFDDTTFYQLGGFERNAIAALEAGGGNNDSGGLWRAAQLALRSGKRHKLLVMISDGSPTECTLASLRNLVTRLTHDFGVACVQVAVAPIEHVAFPDFVDLSGASTEEAITRFGFLLRSFAARWK